jgi:hypothetical protein
MLYNRLKLEIQSKHYRLLSNSVLLFDSNVCYHVEAHPIHKMKCEALQQTLHSPDLSDSHVAGQLKEALRSEILWW